MYSASPFYFNLEKGQPFKFYLGPYTEELLLVYYFKIISRLPFPVVPITMPEYVKLFTKKCFEFEKSQLMLFLFYLFLIYIIQRVGYSFWGKNDTTLHHELPFSKIKISNSSKNQ